VDFRGFDAYRLFKVWRLEVFFNKKWLFGYEVYPTMCGGNYLCLYLIPCLMVRLRIGNYA
jgi:hypothetical protein